MKPIEGGGMRFETPEELAALQQGFDVVRRYANFLDEGLTYMQSELDTHLRNTGDTEPFPPFDLAAGAPEKALEDLDWIVGSALGYVSAGIGQTEVDLPNGRPAEEQVSSACLAQQMLYDYRVEQPVAIPEEFRGETHEPIEEQRAPGE